MANMFKRKKWMLNEHVDLDLDVSVDFYRSQFCLLQLTSATNMHVCLQDVSGMSLSMLAAAGGQDDILRLLIKKGARVNGRQKNGTTALMHAAEKVMLGKIEMENSFMLTWICMWEHTMNYAGTFHCTNSVINGQLCCLITAMDTKCLGFFLFSWNLFSLIPPMCRRPCFPQRISWQQLPFCSRRVHVSMLRLSVGKLHWWR